MPYLGAEGKTGFQKFRALVFKFQTRVVKISALA